MTAGRYDLNIEQGADLDRVFFLKDDAEAVINLTGYDVRMQIRKPRRNLPLIDLPGDDAELLIDGPAGSISLSIPAAVTAAFPVGAAKWDMEIIEPAGKVTRLLQGSVYVADEQTR